MNNKKPQLTNTQRIIKRAFDLFLSVALIVLLLPLLLYISIIVKRTSTGPIFYKQKLAGVEGKEFYALKFRTMFAESIDQKITEASISNDARYTSIGRFLKVTSLDELPQLINVFIGDMSFVGPRPMLVSHYNQLVKNYALIDTIKPGLTGEYQLKIFNEEINKDMMIEELIEVDTDYVTKWSLWLDLKLILRTTRTIFSRKGGY